MSNRRHENCRCVVEYDPGDGKKQNVYSKKWVDLEKKQERIRLDHNNNGNYNNFPTKSLRQYYEEDVANGWISPLCGFDNYLRLYRQIERDIIGKHTENGIEISSQSRHFIQRVIGSRENPGGKTEKKRSCPGKA